MPIYSHTTLVDVDNIDNKDAQFRKSLGPIFAGYLDGSYFTHVSEQTTRLCTKRDGIEIGRDANR